MARGAKEAARQARTEVYRQHVLEAAVRVFAEHGFEATKMQDIAQAADLSLGTIYSVFPGKHELYEAILAEHGQALLALVQEVHDRKLAPREALDALIAIYVDYFVGHPDFLRMHLRSGASWALGPVLGTERQRAYWQRIHGLQADIFRLGVRERAFVNEHPDYLAKLFSVMDQVLLADWVAGGMKASRDTLVARLRAQVRRSFWRA
ncbi:MAG TPA: TetR/AcrR family transcriptional regulator [Candidatus Limnocylindria bacterium]|nr:TetR/AcrR family transcriptional regulator [Candidatus Limnocylindria bacterium]